MFGGLVVIHHHAREDIEEALARLHDSFMSRANTIVAPGGKMDLAMQLIFTPMIWRLMERLQAGGRALSPGTILIELVKEISAPRIRSFATP